MATQRRKAFTIEEKIIIIRRLENGESNSTLAKEFGVGHSTISTIFKNKAQTKESYNANVFKLKRLRKSRQENVDQALFQWFKITTSEGIPVSGAMLQETANDLAARFGVRDFSCSASWISRFKVRHNIVAGKIGGESVPVDNITTTDWLSSLWPDLRKGFSDDEIFNADEIGLFYKLMPHRTLKLKGENCSRGEMSSERFTVMVAANMSGTKKKRLFIIGKSCLNNSTKSLPVDYAYNSKAWMTLELFEKWLRDWDRDLEKKQKKILLLVDDCLIHSKVAGLKSITLAIIPSYTSTALQPMGQGVIQSFKTNFRKNLLLKIINSFDSNDNQFSTNITMLNAIIMVNDAWNKLSRRTIQNGFMFAGYSKKCSTLPVQTEHQFEDDVPFSVWVQNLNFYSLAPPGLWEDYIDIDSDLITSEETIYPISPINWEQHDIDKQVDKLPTAIEAFKAAEILSQFYFGNTENYNLTTAMSMLNNNVRDCYYNFKRKQIQNLKIEK